MLACSFASAQELRHEVAVTGGAGASSMRYDILGGNDNPLKFGFKAGLGYTFFLSDYWGIGTGVEFARYNNKVTLPDGLAYSTPALGGNSQPGQHRNYVVTTSGFVETQKLSTINIPLMVQFNAPASKSVRFYTLAGVKVGLPVMSSWTQSISRISTGYLSMGENAGSYQEGIGIDNYTSEGDFEVKPSLMLAGELGIKFRLSKSLFLYAGAYIDYGLNDIRKNTAEDANLIHYAENSPQATTGNSLVSVSSAISNVNLLSCGLNLRLGIGFGKKKEKSKPEPEPVVQEKIVERIVERVVRDTVVKEVHIRDTVVQEVVKEIVREVPQEIKQSMIKLSNTLFAFDKWNLTEEAAIELNKVAAWISENPEISIEIEGHTDNKGSAEYNRKLSEERAKSVYDYFVSKGIEPSRLSYRGYGLTRPIADNATEEGRQQNRRVELKIINQ